MNITGKITLDPVVLAEGKDRARVIRRHAQVLAACCRPYLPHLEGKNRRLANKLDDLLSRDPSYWIRRQGQNISTAQNLDKLLAHAHVCREIEKYPAIKTALLSTLQTIDASMVLTKQDPGWAIMKVDRDHIRPYLEEIRASGTQISCSAWGAHISVIRGELQQWGLKQKHEINAMSFQVTVKTTIRQNRRGYYWLDVQSKDLEELRLHLGLPPRPRPPFHLTIGKAC